ncbi:MAG: hypothetical protein MK198_13125 [Gracilimonas sp.]|uniref:hypothetical protein n=1 Tax=Gracilimonas sp. TaxID=1974203 RepID=UPI0037526F4F|nr:hypothetical protein [Gracilimonas sp.]
MKFDFSDISFTGIPGAVGNDSECTESSDHSDRPICRDIAGYIPAHGKQNGAEKYVDTILNSSPKKSQKQDSITDFYSDLANNKGVLPYLLMSKKSDNRLERTFEINKNTADRHGRT